MGRHSAKPTCFVEQDPGASLLRRAAAEAIGTFMLMLVVAGSAARAHDLGHVAPAFASSVGAVAVSGSLVGLILAFGAVSGGHFNPLITMLQWLGKERSLRCTAVYLVAQVAGALSACILARMVFDAPLAAAAPPTLSSALDEAVASAGLMMIVLGCSRSGRSATGPFAVGAWLAGAIVAVPSLFYANPALAIAANLTSRDIDRFFAETVLAVAMEVLGGLAAFVAIRLTFPRADQVSP